MRASAGRQVSGWPWPTPDPGAGGCCSCPGQGHSCWSCFHGSKARSRRPGCAECLRLGGTADRKSSTKGTFLLGDQPCPPAQQRWVTLTAHTQGLALCCDSSAHSPKPPLPELLCRVPLGWLPSFWAQIPDKGTVAVLHSVQRQGETGRGHAAGAAPGQLCVPGRAWFVCSLGSKHLENQLAHIQQTGVISF